MQSRGGQKIVTGSDGKYFKLEVTLSLAQSLSTVIKQGNSHRNMQITGIVVFL